MLVAVRGFRVCPLVLGLGLMLMGVVASYGDRDPVEELESGTVMVEMVQPRFEVPPGAQLLADLEYDCHQGRPLHLDLYRPEEIAAPLPVIVWIHGDGWRAGSKAAPRSAVEFVARGYAVASIDYRLSDEALFPAQIEDCQAAVRWLRSHAEEYHLDPLRIAAWGEGAGGHLAALLGTKSASEPSTDGVSPAVQAVIDFGGPVDFLQLDALSLGHDAVQHNHAWSPESLLVGGLLTDRQELVTQTNPIHYLTNDRRPPPFLIVHSRQDPVIPFPQSELLARALLQCGGKVQFLRLEELYHNSTISRELEDVVSDFLSRRLLAEQPAEERSIRPHHRKDLKPRSRSHDSQQRSLDKGLALTRGKRRWAGLRLMGPGSWFATWRRAGSPIPAPASEPPALLPTDSRPSM